jgi:ferredoxin/flavodoxin---NADP+ reductase
MTADSANNRAQCGPARLTYNATLAARIDLTEALTIFKLAPDKPPGKNPWMAAGQYCVIGMNNESEPHKGSVRRAMSIVSAPEETGLIEFYLRYVGQPESDNPLTHLMWPIKEGDRMYMRTVATGKFTLRGTAGEGDDRLKIFVAAGTGAAPFVSMVRSEVLRAPDVDLGNFVFLHGVSYPHDLGYRDELRRLRDKNGLHYFATVSRPQAAPDWKGHTGRVEDFFQPGRVADFAERIGLARDALTPRNAVILVCGLQGTIGTCISRLLAHGFIPEHRRMRQAFEAPEGAPSSLFYEQYDKTPVINIKDPAVVAPLKDALANAVAAGLVPLS